MIEVSVVIATKDRRQYLARALASLERQVATVPFEVVVVDNGSGDDTAALVAGYGERALPVHYVAEPQPNRAKARNRGVEVCHGEYVLFCDDDVQTPPGWIAAHAAAQREGDRVVNGPILNVNSAASRPAPSPANYSRAFLCTCNASLPRRVFVEAGGFDERFDLYGWEDTELGLRLRERGLGWKFAWDAYLWHIKPPESNSLAVESRKAVEKARMAQRFLRKHPSSRARFATGAYAVNLLRGRYLLPDWLLAIYAGLAASSHLPAAITALMRAQLLDGIYTRELVRTLDSENA